MKTWIFQETGEERNPHRGEFYLNEFYGEMDSIQRSHFEHSTPFKILVLMADQPKDYAQCPRCFSYFSSEGTVPMSVFDVDAIPLDKGNIRFCVVCGATL